MHNFGGARESFDSAIAALRDLRRPGRLAKALFECAMMLQSQGLVNEAATYLMEALDQARALSAERMIQRFESGGNKISTDTLLRALLEAKVQINAFAKARARASERWIRSLTMYVALCNQSWGRCNLHMLLSNNRAVQNLRR